MNVDWHGIEIKAEDGRRYLEPSPRLYLDGTFEVDGFHVSFTEYLEWHSEIKLTVYELVDGEIGRIVEPTQEQIDSYTQVITKARTKIRKGIDEILEEYDY